MKINFLWKETIKICFLTVEGYMTVECRRIKVIVWKIKVSGSAEIVQNILIKFKH